MMQPGVGNATPEEPQPPAPMSQQSDSFKEKYIRSLEALCAVSDAVRSAENVTHALARDAASLGDYVATLSELCAKNGVAVPAEPSVSLKTQIQMHELIMSQLSAKIATPAPLPPAVTAPAAPPPSRASSLALNLSFKLPAAPEFEVDGGRNERRLRAWTDIIRAKYPTFRRTSPAMSKTAREFASSRNQHDLISSITNDRVSRPMQAIPEYLIPDFVDIMETVYLRDGMFGDASCHDME
ncbi:hypothetical protein BC830DRAFT_378996 [Chytriomyces sp. MP71]|nr:hypothetical protein BC830DRAFT_378996 [Chytriomyces sp. MP71]